MTEAEWRACTDPEKMMAYLRRQRTKGNARNWRLFACACCRRIWPLLADDRSRRAVDVAERYADGLASRAELEAARRASGAVSAVRWREGPVVAADDAAGHASATRVNAVAAADNASTAWAVAVSTGAAGSDAKGWGEAKAKEKQAQCGLLRDIFGNPFCPIALDLAWLAWQGGTIPKLAASTYEERQLPSGHLDPARLAILADALEEAGCTDQEILSHLRGSGPHVRGCHVIDLLLSKS